MAGHVASIEAVAGDITAQLVDAIGSGHPRGLRGGARTGFLESLSRI
jgi:hypothetical protein